MTELRICVVHDHAMKRWEKHMHHEQERSKRFPLQPTEDPTVWRTTLIGPKGSLYEGTEFTVEFKIPSAYPFEAPHPRFQTPIYHPNIHESGFPYCAVIDTWSPSKTLETIMAYFEDILKTPEPGFGYNYEASLLLQTDRVAYEAAVLASLSKMRASEPHTVNGTHTAD